ncbi:outer membrane protein assembly factor BamD [Thiotrichales bacterium 19S3-7]|nr:outer membrane protein assembly factor BamD [Thiotrichales bacterium 19S3-7]MCF6801177.1 outer membrane protein assembly factor BamD [Thiotrichales bacterium 19S3-11]
MRKIFALGCALVIMLISGCASDKGLPYQGDSAKFIYATGHNYMVDGNYTDAIEAFRSLMAQYPFEYYSQKGMLDLMYSYHQKGDDPMALAIAEQYLKLYPTNEERYYAYYMLGIVYSDNGRGFLQKYLPYDMTTHDPTGYKRAFYNFKQVVALAPDTPFAEDARRRMIYLKGVIAQYELNIAEFYLGKGAYVAAINRAKIVVKQYPKTTQVEGALVVMLKAYQRLNLVKLVNSTSDVIKENYPNNSYLTSLEKSKKRTTARL